MSFWELMMTLLIVVPLILLWVFTLIDIFKRENLSGAAKALWAIAILFLPLIGMVVYFVTRPPDPLDKPEPNETSNTTSADDRPTTTADQLNQLSSLHDSGKLSDEEFAASKADLLGDQSDG
jgi:hypothetical protein